MEWAVILRAPSDPAIVSEDRWRPMWQERLAAARPVTIDWNEHQTDDAKWRYGSIDDYGAIRAAVFNVVGMMDSYLPSATRMMERVPQVPQKALIGRGGINGRAIPIPPAGAAIRLRPPMAIPGALSGPARRRHRQGPPGARTYDCVDGSETETFETAPGVGTRYGEAYHLRRTITEGDPNSAAMECTGINSYARGDWQVRLRAWSRLRSTAADFLCEETFEAFEGDRRVFHREWSKRIPRRLV